MGHRSSKTISRIKTLNKIRVISRIDVKNDDVIKGIHLEGLRKVGKPNDLAKKYYDAGVDEIIFMDAVAAYYDRNSLSEIIKKACNDVFVPITVGGGIRTVQDIQSALNAGADKVAINTKAIHDHGFIERAAKTFGSQCIVLSIDAKRIAEGKWEAYTDNGREPTGLDVIDWARKVQSLGAGEIMLTSIDAEGTKKGFDVELNAAVASSVSIPIIASGGAGNGKHVTSLLDQTTVDAVAVASLLHYGIESIKELKELLLKDGHRVRSC
jgi:imidazole glycerol-phosphate synthase subunit HisF